MPRSDRLRAPLSEWIRDAWTAVTHTLSGTPFPPASPCPDEPDIRQAYPINSGKAVVPLESILTVLREQRRDRERRHAGDGD